MIKKEEKELKEFLLVTTYGEPLGGTQVLIKVPPCSLSDALGSQQISSVFHVHGGEALLNDHHAYKTIPMEIPSQLPPKHPNDGV